MIDPSALLDLERAGSDWTTGLGALGAEPVALPAIVVAELLAGARLVGARDEAHFRRVPLLRVERVA